MPNSFHAWDQVQPLFDVCKPQQSWEEDSPGQGVAGLVRGRRKMGCLLAGITLRVARGYCKGCVKEGQVVMRWYR